MDRRSTVPRAAALGVLVAVAYAAVVLAVIGVEHRSESQKLARGAYTDTLPPLGFSRLAAAPGSFLGPPDRYPVTPIDEHTYRQVVDGVTRACLAATGVQAVLLGAAVTALRRRPAAHPQVAGQPRPPS